MAALLLVVTLFADVIFLGASISPLDYVDALKRSTAPERTVSLLPERAGRLIDDSWGDTGSAGWQLQPAIRFMAYVLRSGESPYWNPYAATGSMGPETLADLKFSAVTLVAAICGGASDTYSFVLLFLYVVSSAALIQICTRYLRTDLVSGLAAAVVFLLNGFALANLNTAIGQPYFVAPVALLGLLAAAERPDTRRVALAALGDACLFSVTFLPTMVLAAIGVHVVALTMALFWFGSAGNRLRQAAVQVSIPVLATGLLGFLYLPAIDAFLHYADTLGTYSARQTPGFSLHSLLSLFTPKHFWQSYRALRVDPLWPAGEYQMWLFHLGVVASLLAGNAFSRRHSKRVQVLTWVCGGLIVVSLGQVFDIFPFTYIDRLPFFSFVRTEYWHAMTCLALWPLVAIGFSSVRVRTAGWCAALVAAVILSSFLFLLGQLGFPSTGPERIQIAIFLGIFLGAGVLLGFAAVRPTSQRLTQAVLFGLLAGESLWYMNHLRPVRSGRDEQLSPVLAWLKSKLASPAGGRLLNIGATGVMPDWGSGLQTPELGTLEIGDSPRYRSFFDSQIGAGLFLSLPYPSSPIFFSPETLSAVGVKYIAVDRTCATARARLHRFGFPVIRQDDVREIFENPKTAPRVIAVGSLTLAAPDDWRIPKDFHSVASTSDAQLIRAARDLHVPDRSGGTEDAGDVAITAYHHTHVIMRANLRRPAVLVMFDGWHPNWRARVNGRDVHLGWVDGAFRGLAIGPGTAMIELTYWPPMLTPGLIVSAAALCLVICFLILRRSFARPVLAGHEIRSEVPFTS